MLFQTLNIHYYVTVNASSGVHSSRGDDVLFNIYIITSQLTPAVGFIVVVAMMFVIPDVPRGAADSDTNVVANESETRSSGFKGYMEDLAYITKKYVVL